MADKSSNVDRTFSYSQLNFIRAFILTKPHDTYVSDHDKTDEFRVVIKNNIATIYTNGEERKEWSVMDSICNFEEFLENAPRTEVKRYIELLRVRFPSDSLTDDELLRLSILIEVYY